MKSKDTINATPNNFSFTVDGEVEDNGKIVLHMKGRHYSINSINSFSFGAKLRYKKTIKQAFYYFFLTHGKNLIPNNPFKLS